MNWTSFILYIFIFYILNTLVFSINICFLPLNKFISIEQMFLYSCVARIHYKQPEKKMICVMAKIKA